MQPLDCAGAEPDLIPCWFHRGRDIDGDPEAGVGQGTAGAKSLGYWGAIRFNASATAPTRIRLTAQLASRLNQLRETNFKPR
jgi:hypothetical protein